MKKTLIKIALFSAVAGFLLTSCLGDTNSTVSGTNTGYIKDSNTIRYASLYNLGYSGTPITSTEISKLQLNKFYFINYEIDYSDPLTNGIYQAKTGVDLTKDKLFTYNSVYEGEKTFNEVFPNDYPTTILQAPLMNSITSVLFANDKSWDDKWIFAVNYTAYKDEIGETAPFSDNVELKAYYFEDKQTSSGSESRPNVYIQLSLVRRNAVTTTNQDTGTDVRYMVIDFTRLRAYLERKYTEKNQQVNILIQYPKVQNSVAKLEPVGNGFPMVINISQQ